MRGEAAAHVFYDETRFTRAGAAPLIIRKTLFGDGGVQGLDGERHRRRKRLFLSLMSPDRIDTLAADALEAFDARSPAWERADGVVLYQEIGRVLCEAVCAWSGVPLPAADVARRTADLHAMIDGGGSLGPRFVRGVTARKRAERWVGDLIEQVRAHKLEAPDATALYAVAWHRDAGGQLLDTRTAAVELLNVLRPTVAVDRFIVYAALALHDHPGWRDRLRTADDELKEAFVQEVRRYYPFFPFVGARVRTSFVWRGYRFREGQRVLFDLYGTNHDPHLWPAPDRFDPERFLGWTGNAFSFVPQGGGDAETGHRCPGEPIAVALMKAALDALTQRIAYRVPEQDLRVSLTRMPTLPRSGFVVTDVRRLQSPAPASRAESARGR
jgi:fatty-acid peroxygenase